MTTFQIFDRTSTMEVGRPPLPNERPQTIFNVGEVLSEMYEIRSVIGSGGMGQVYEAQDVVLNRRVAIKAAWPHIGGTPLRREAQAMAAIRHSSMVTVHLMARHRGIDYLVMERIYGVSLEAHLAQRRGADERFTVQETLDVLIALAEGLSAVHRAGV